MNICKCDRYHKALSAQGLYAWCLLLGALSTWLPGSAFAAPRPGHDIKGSHDSPLISRYKGSWILGYRQLRYGALALPLGKYVHGKFVKSRQEEGELTRILYVNPPRRSALEVFRNYQQALQGAGFKRLFECEGRSGCGSVFHQGIYPQAQQFTSSQQANFALSGVSDQFCLSAELQDAAHGNAFVSLYVATDANEAGVYSGPKRVMTLLQIVQTRPMQTGQVKVDAAALASGLASKGHIAIYGVYFDTDSAHIKPASRVQLAEMARFLKSHPRAGVYVVGHTDDQGSLSHNLDLSRRRAKAVVSALVDEYHVSRGRLDAEGVGPLAPVAVNTTSAGRAKNRRVELVAR